MDNDTKHVLTILGFVACFGAGYFVCNAENKDVLQTGERFSIFSKIENTLDGKKEMTSDNKEKAIENAVNGYYQTDDKYFEYYSDVTVNPDNQDDNYSYTNNYSIDNNIVYINSNNFFMDGVQGFTKFFRDNPDMKTDGYIIDLRENIGGHTDYCLGVLGYFLEQPLTVGEYHYYNGDRKPLNISGDKKTNNEKVVILVNEKTASSAEIFTASMKQFYDGEVQIIGTQTKGKGTFQEYESLSDNEQFRYTAGTYTVGDWQCYDGVGITPDIELSMDYNPDIICTDEDIQLQKALDLFK